MSQDYSTKCIENKNSIFKVLSNEQKDLLLSNMSCIPYKRNEVIFKEGFNPSGLLSLAKGKVKIYKDGLSGKEQILRLANQVTSLAIEHFLQMIITMHRQEHLKIQ